ncbi:DUF952 domain-containing protein [Mycobacterium spongiae]|uniref:DUF952 domain-containing protein n=1 Tax=Mycobacterium spongiae TaxID=886343 RepID=A0A975JWP8_9MYCO|nr:DUF952 domain-containing protein [Mycobacterium spongiae]
MTSDPPLLVHLCGTQAWSQALRVGEIRPESGDSPGAAGFIHLSTLEQVHLPANRLYRGHRDLLLLYIDTAALNSPVRWEPGVPTDPEAMLFPHLYGPLPVHAVSRATAYRPARDGTFPPATELADGAQDAT